MESVNMLRLFFVGVLLVGTGCAAAPYKKADMSMYAGRQGYLEKQVGPGKYILEYSHIGGYNYNLELNTKYWTKRATELCPNGFDGKPEAIFPGDAKIKEFVCPQNFCADYPLVSGIIECRNLP
jgi:hypothetical protein